MVDLTFGKGDTGYTFEAGDLGNKTHFWWCGHKVCRLPNWFGRVCIRIRKNNLLEGR